MLIRVFQTVHVTDHLDYVCTNNSRRILYNKNVERESPQEA